MKSTEKRTLAYHLEKCLQLLHISFVWIVPILLLAILATGIFRVQSDEVAVILRFGRLAGDGQHVLQPGLHFAFPYVIDEVVRIPVAKVRKVVVDTHAMLGDPQGDNLRQNGYVLTGDHNMLHIEATAKYHISDPISYALHHENSERSIDNAVSRCVFSIASREKIDVLLTTGKRTLADEILQEAQTMLDDLQCGVTLTGIEITKLEPPKSLMNAFEAVTTATVHKQTLIESANAYREAVVPKAQAEAQALLDNAKSDQRFALAQIHEDTALFNSLLPQYQISPASTLETTILQRRMQLFQRLHIFVLPKDQPPATLILP